MYKTKDQRAQLKSMFAQCASVKMSPSIIKQGKISQEIQMAMRL
jgi:hypothetical protein